MSEPTSTTAVPTVAESTRTNGKDKEPSQSQESTPAMQPKKPASAETKASNGENNANNSNNTPPTSSAPPTSASAQSPKSQKSRKSNSTPRGGGAPASPSTRGSDNGKNPVRPDASSVSATGTVGLGVVAGAGTDTPTSSSGDKGAETQHKPPQRTSGFTSRRGRPSDSRNSSPSITPPASTSEARFANARGGGYSSRGRDDDNIRGRKFDSRQNRTAPAERASTSTTGAESDPSASADTGRPFQQSNSQGFSDVRKQSGYSTRSPLSPRSPRRGFGERGMDSRRNTHAVAQEGSAASSPQVEAGSSTLAASQNKRKPNRKSKKPEDDDGSVVSVGSAKGSENAVESKDSTRNNGARDYRTNQQQPRDWKNDSTASGRQRNDARRDAPETASAADWTSNAVKNTDKRDSDDAQSGWGDAPTTTSTQQTDGWGSSANVSLKWGEDLPWEKSDKKDSSATKSSAAPKPKAGRAAERKNGDDSEKGWGNSPVEPTTSNQTSGWGESPNTNLERGKGEPLSKDTKKDWAANKHAATAKPKTTRAPVARNSSNSGSGWGDAPSVTAKMDEAGGWGKPENTNSKWGEEAARDNNNTKKEAPPARAQRTSAPRAFNKSDRGDDNATQDGRGVAPEAASGAAPADGWGAPIVTNKKWGEDLPWEQTPSSNVSVSDIAPSTTPKAPSKPERKEHNSAQDNRSDARVTDSVVQSSGGWGEPAATTKKWGEDLPWESSKDAGGSGSASNKAAKDTSASNGWGDAPATDSKANQADGWGAAELQ
ncbi:hypothetical protein BGZ72_010740 [Mortierella alpina]|nr:hypothetical protein BGZ72_010740 [Mortierella alpina]